MTNGNEKMANICFLFAFGKFFGMFEWRCRGFESVGVRSACFIVWKIGCTTIPATTTMTTAAIASAKTPTSKNDNANNNNGGNSNNNSKHSKDNYSSISLLSSRLLRNTSSIRTQGSAGILDPGIPKTLGQRWDDRFLEAHKYE